MKFYIPICLIIILCSCNSNKQNGRQSNSQNSKWLVRLESLNATISIELPKEYDTALNWVLNNSHCPSRQHRIQSSKYPLYENSCLIDSAVPYEKLQVTFIEPIYDLKKGPNTTEKEIIAMHRQEVKYAINDPQTNKTQFDTLVDANGTLYSIFANAYHDNIHQVYGEKLESAVFINGNRVQILFEKTTKRPQLDRSKYIGECISYLKSLKISNGT